MNSTDRDVISAALDRPPRLPTPIDSDERRRIVSELLVLDSKITQAGQRVAEALARVETAEKALAAAERDMAALFMREDELEREAGIERGTPFAPNTGGTR